MRTLLEDGIDKAARGLTTIEELLSVVPLDAALESPAESRKAPAVAVPAVAPTSPSSALHREQRG